MARHSQCRAARSIGDKGTAASDARHFCLSSLRVKHPPRHNDRSMKLDSPLFNRIRVKPEADRAAARRRAGLPVAGLRAGGDASGAEGARARARVLALLPRPRARVQPFLQLLRRHERRRGRALSEGRRDRPPADLEDGLQRRRRGTHVRPRARPGRPVRRGARVRPGPGGRASSARPPEQRVVRNAERKAFDTLGLDIDAAAADIKARFKELVKRHLPTPMAATARSKTGCARSFRRTIISSRRSSADWRMITRKEHG